MSACACTKSSYMPKYLKQQPVVFQNTLQFHLTKWCAVNKLNFLIFFFLISTKKSPSQLTIFFQFDHQKIWLSVYQYNTFVDAHDENVFSKYVSFHSNTMHIPNRINLHERDCSADIFVSITKGRRFYSCIALLKIVFNPK